MKKDYTTATLEEYLELPQNNSNTVLAIPAKAMKEIEDAKNYKTRAELVNKAFKKYLINAKQAQTNAKIVEALIA